MRWRERLLGWLRRPRGPGAELGVLPPAEGPDRVLVAVVLALTGFGIVMVFSAGAAFAAKTCGDFAYFLKREAVYTAVGLVGFAVAVRLDYGFYRRIAYPLLAVAMAMLVVVLKIGPSINGAVRWFRVGSLSFQPSEVAKFALVLYLAMLLARKAGNVKDFSMGFLPPLIMTGVFLVLLLKQPDLGTALIIGVTALGLMFVAGTRTSYILLSVLVAAPVGWKLFIAGEPWRMRRFLAFLNPWEYRRGSGYQLYESLISVGSGGIYGQGLGQGRQKLFFLPEAHTDFILAIVGEELGMIGLLSVVAAFAILVWRGLRASVRARDAFGCYLAFGITFLFGLQALVNMCVVLGLLPTKGLPLPFVSYGGTALVMSLFMAGVLVNIAARNPEPARATARSRRKVLRNRRQEGAGVRVMVVKG